jgi:CRP-like cAMP-binding protein
MSRSVPATDIYAILSGWARAQRRMATASADTSTAPLARPSAQPPAQAEISAYLQESARQLAERFSQQNTVQVQLNDHGLNIDQALQHDAVLAWQALRETPPTLDTLPERCPQCDHFLSQWHCGMCGLELARWKHREHAFTDSMGALPWGYTLTADPRRRRLIFLRLAETAAPKVVWQINFPAAFIPQSAQLISAGEVLVASEQGQLQIIDLFGEVVWSSTLQFKNPVQVQAIFKSHQRNHEDTVDRFLMVDEAMHQVMVINRANEVLWSYGTENQPGKDLGFLRSPQSACLMPDGNLCIADTGNRRVIEVSEVSRTIRRELLSHQHLEAPGWCDMLPDGHFSVIDTLHYRFYEVDAHDELLSSCAYYQDALDLRYRVKDACAFLRRENGHVLIGNRDRLVEISPSQKRLLWYIPLTDLRLEAHQSKTQPYTPPQAKDPLRTTLHTTLSTRLKTPFQLDRVLREISVFQGAPGAFFDKIKLCLRYEEYPAGQILLREGQRGDAMFLLREGEVEVLKGFQKVATLHAGDIFGEMALLHSAPRTATVKTLSLCRVYRLNKVVFESVIQLFPEVHARIKTLSEARQLSESGEPQQPVSNSSISTAARERLQQLMQRKAVRPLSSNAGLKERLAAGPTHWKLRYTEIEQHVIEEAAKSNYQCLELHIALSSTCRMKSTRVSLVVMQLEKIGEIIKTYPTPEAILKEKIDNYVVLTLLTQESRTEAIEQAATVSDILEVKAIPVKL